MSNAEESEFSKDFDKRIAERKAKEEREQKELSEKMRQEYMSRTGRTRMEP